MLGREYAEAVVEIEERERRRFRPFICVHTAHGAHSFLTALGERKSRYCGCRREQRSSQKSTKWLPHNDESDPGL